MKRVLIISLFAVMSCVTFGQYASISNSLIYESAASIGLASGGVVFRKVAIPEDSDIDFLKVSLNDPGNSMATLIFHTTDGKVTFSSKSFLIRDAAFLVQSETDSIFKNVDLTGEPTWEEEDSLGYLANLDHYFVEMSEPLIGTKTGEILLSADLLLTAPECYSALMFTKKNTYPKPNAYIQEINKGVLQSMYGKYELGKLDYSDYSKVDSIRLNQYIKSKDDNWFIESSVLTYPDNWTYHDDHMDYSFLVDKESKRLILKGRPFFTFLHTSFNEDHDKVFYDDEEFTKFYQENPQYIDQLREDTFKDAAEFSRICSLFRYLKLNEAKTWEDLHSLCIQIEKVGGMTPRIIPKR